MPSFLNLCYSSAFLILKRARNRPRNILGLFTTTICMVVPPPVGFGFALLYGVSVRLVTA